MKDKGHFYASIAKSLLRFGVCVVIFIMAKDYQLKFLSGGLGVAELFGILEEICDKR
jgi:hypothetical protein